MKLVGVVRYLVLNCISQFVVGFLRHFCLHIPFITEKFSVMTEKNTKIFKQCSTLQTCTHSCLCISNCPVCFTSCYLFIRSFFLSTLFLSALFSIHSFFYPLFFLSPLLFLSALFSIRYFFYPLFFYPLFFIFTLFSTRSFFYPLFFLSALFSIFFFSFLSALFLSALFSRRFRSTRSILARRTRW